jgi:capsular exopolysaccharide synthesis family protein
VETAHAPALAWRDGPVALGTAVFAVTNPASVDVRVTVGTVSAVGRGFRGPRGRLISGGIEHTAPLARGSSGSPLVDAARSNPSTTAANIAITLAYADMPTILIDADFRKPVIHTLFDLEQEPGITNYLASDMPLNDVIKHTKTRNLDVITVGIIPPNPSELLNKSKVDALIKELKKHYSYIIFDTAPILPVTDPAILGSKVDGAFIVVELGKTTIEAVTRSESLLNNTKTNVYGVILNKISMTVGRYGHYYYYYHYDKYYHEKKQESKLVKIKEYLAKFYRYLIG